MSITLQAQYCQIPGQSEPDFVKIGHRHIAVIFLVALNPAKQILLSMQLFKSEGLIPSTKGRIIIILQINTDLNNESVNNKRK